MNTFKKDLEFGHYFENKVIEALFEGEDNLQITQAPTGHFCDWDFQVKNKDTNEILYYEVKAERAILRTGNFFIETQSKFNEPSGLNSTKANFYILVKPKANLKDIDCIYEVETEYLKYLQTCETKELVWRRSCTGSYGFLLNEKFLSTTV
jgi:hypothetical protein